MNIYRCPSCGTLSLIWDARSGSFLCRAKSCNYSADPPSDEPEGTAANKISTGRLIVRQEWIDDQFRILGLADRGRAGSHPHPA